MLTGARICEWRRGKDGRWHKRRGAASERWAQGNTTGAGELGWLRGRVALALRDGNCRRSDSEDATEVVPTRTGTKTLLWLLSFDKHTSNA